MVDCFGSDWPMGTDEPGSNTPKGSNKGSPITKAFSDSLELATISGRSFLFPAVYAGLPEGTRWCPSSYKLVYHPINYRYIYHKS